MLRLAYNITLKVKHIIFHRASLLAEFPACLESDGFVHSPVQCQVSQSPSLES